MPSDNPKNKLCFDIDEVLCVPFAGEDYPAFKDPAGMDVLQKVATALTMKGYTVTKVKPAKGIHAGFETLLNPSCKIEVLLEVGRERKGYVSCDLITRRSRPFFRFFEVEDKLECIKQWIVLCNSMDEIVLELFGVFRTDWVTENTFRAERRISD